MKVSRTALALAAATLANAQLNVDPCALQCLLTALGQSPCENTLDFACQCAQPQLAAIALPCIQAACTPEQIADVATTITETCAAAGVPIQLPPIGGSSSAPPSSAAPTETPSESPSPTESEPAPTEPPAETEEPTPTGTGGLPIPTPEPTESPPPFDGAGSSVRASFGGLAAAALAVAAYL